MLAEKLSAGDLIGIISPSHIAGEGYKQIVRTIEQLGFRVKLGSNIFKNTHGYLASEQERADDLNRMVADDEVKMVLFGGGWGANEILPLIDYAGIACHPKLFSSYSDGTSILAAIYTQTGLITYYGLGAVEFENLMHYDYIQFSRHFVNGRKADGLCGGGAWRTIRSGTCDGILLGGYTLNFAWLIGGAYFRYDAGQKYILFLEDHEKFNPVIAVSAYLSHIEQSPLIHNVGGLIFGHYANQVPEDLCRRLERFGEKHDIPVVYTDDFGHETRHSILPIGVPARLDADRQTLQFLSCGRPSITKGHSPI